MQEDDYRIDEDFPREPNSSEDILEDIVFAERAFRSYNDMARRIDEVYSTTAYNQGVINSWGWTDQEYDLFWSSIEILKPAIYAKPPVVVAKPRFSDANRADKVVSELLERAVNCEFENTDIDQVMLSVRDDLAILNRGVPWVTYEERDGKKRICVEHLDRTDFIHEPARKWSEVGWVARKAWMTRKEMRDRFKETSGFAYEDAVYDTRRHVFEEGSTDNTLKAAVWEVWNRHDNKVYWVTDGVKVLLDESEPHLNLSTFFPCPRPAYGTVQRGTLIPIPDYRRYAALLGQINLTTAKIYDLLAAVKVAGFFPGGGDVSSAIETAMASTATTILIPLGSIGEAQVQWLPLDVIANTITGLIGARTQLFDDFYQLSGISDIMRGATESEETLGAQRLKSQYGSVRVKDKIDEMIRVARDLARIALEIMCENYSKDDMFELAQITLPSKREVEKSLKEVRDAARKELQDLATKAEEMAQQNPDVDPAQAEQEFAKAQQEIIARFQPQIEEIGNAVTSEAAMEIIRDQRARSIAIDIETDSTIMVDETAEKAARSEFLAAFSNAVAASQPLMMAGEAGAKLAGGMLKFAMAPFRPGRDLQTLIDEFIEAAPEMAAQMAQQGGEEEGMGALAEAEMAKAEAQMEKVKADSQLKQAELQTRMAEMQQKAAENEQKAQLEIGKLQLASTKQEQEFAAKMADLDAKQNLMQAQTAEILARIGLDVRKQDLEEYKTAEEMQMRAVDQAVTIEDKQVDREFRERGEMRSDRQQEFTERSAMEEGNGNQ